MRTETTIFQMAVLRVGLRRGYLAMSFMADWIICSRALGREPENVDEFARWWLRNVRMAYRGQADFRAAFPEFASPNDLAVACGVDLALLQGRESESITFDALGWVLA